MTHLNRRRHHAVATTTANRTAGGMRRALVAAAALSAAALAALLPRAALAEGVTTLDEISIEGEVRLPRVLFITSRDIVRPMDFLDHYAADPMAVFGPQPESLVLPVLGGPLVLAADAPIEALRGTVNTAPHTGSEPVTTSGSTRDIATPENPSSTIQPSDGSSEEVHP